MYSASLIGWHVFLASLLVLVFLRADKTHLNLRIFMLGVCFGAFVLSFTSSPLASAVIAVAIWSPKPLISWWQRRAMAAETEERRPLNPFKPDGELQAKQTYTPIAGRPGFAWARAWFNAWVQVHVTAFMFLFRAVEGFNEKVFRLFMHFVIMREQAGETFHQAVARGDVEKVEKLVRARVRTGAAISDPDAEGRTPLHAALRGLEEAVADDDDDDDDDDGDGSAVEATAAKAARRKGHAEWLRMIRILLDNRCDANARDADGRLPIHMAVRGGAPFHEVAKSLVDAGADVTLLSGRGRSTLHEAAIQKDTTMTEMILRAAKAQAAATSDGAPTATLAPAEFVNCKGKDGWTALGLAARGGDAGSVRALLDAGAERHVLMVNGKTALDIARLNKRGEDVVRLLDKQ
jgi:ankyrin repeat protein